METSILAGRLGQPGQKVPRSLGFSAPVTQSADAADAVQLPRLSSAWANNSASFGSFPAVSRISLLRIQPIAVRRAGRLTPWQGQPGICRLGWSRPLTDPRRDRAAPGWPAARSSVTATDVLS